MREIGEVKRLRRELEVSKTRFWQILVALSKKLQDKEKELRDSHELRDRQLATVLRSLLTLESRLRKEQTVIRKQLVEKDELIQQQAKEILRLKQPKNEVEPDEYTYKASPIREYRDNPVLESVQQILLKDEEDLMTDVQPVKSGVQKNRVEVGVAWYESDSSLLVTEIGEEVIERRVPEEMVVKVVPPENCALPSPKEPSGAWCIKVIEAEELPPGGHERLWVKDRVSPPTKAQHSEERACLQMAKRTLTIAYPKTAEEIEAKSITVLESSYQELVPVKSPQSPKKSPNQQTPPALPPKPTRLLKPSELFRRTEETKVKPEVQPKPRVHLQEMKRKQMNGHIPGNAKPQVTFAPEARIEKPPERSPTKKSPPTQNGHSSSPEVKKPRGEDASIRICSSVSSLIMGAVKEGNVSDLTTEEVPQEETPEVTLQDNFEEFKLEECYVESVQEGDGRPQAEGAEGSGHYGMLPPPPPPDTCERTYETFLESTGLSQKSILTPSRMLSNHRSCLKPKDVKHRNKVKAAAVGLGPTTKYWTEPYL